jgi:hypothetical protein
VASFAVKHLEKLTSEYLLGPQYDVWDAHTNEGRWWVITNPTNLYSQELIKSMDVALSFHVGLMSNEATIWSMALAETQQLRMLERLRSAGKQPVTLGDAPVGFDFPAVVISELELHGYAIDRVYEHGRLIGVRLLERKVPDPPASRRRQRWRRPSR